MPMIRSCTRSVVVVVVAAVTLGAPAMAAPAPVNPPVDPPATRPAGPVVDWGSQATGASAPPAGLNGVVGVSAGESSVVALRGDGTVLTWGAGAPAVPAGLHDVTQVSAGATGAVALLTGGTATTWGYGVGTASELGGGLVAVDAGTGFSLGLTAAGTVRASGTDLTGATDVPAGLDHVVAVAAGGFRGVSATPCGYALALGDDGTVTGWGHSSFGQGCSVDLAGAATPPAGLDDVVAIAAGARHSLALRRDGTVVGWGPDADAATPPAGLDHVVAVAAGDDESIALRADGTVTVWGRDGDTTPPGLRDVTAVTIGNGHAAAVVVAAAVGAARLMPRADLDAAGTAEAFAGLAAAAGPVRHLRVYLDAGNRSRRVVVGLYAADGTAPGRLLTSGVLTDPAPGRWHDVPVATTSLVAGRTYWLALLGSSGAGRLAFRDLADGTGGPTRTSAQRTLTDLPTTWRSGTSFGNAPVSAYALG